MTHYHLYIIAGHILDETAIFYKVGVGTSKQAQRDHQFLLDYAAKHGHFYRIIDRSTDDFYHNCKKSLYPHSVTTQLISARDLVRNLKAKLRQPLSPKSLAAAHQQAMSLNLDYRISSRLAAG